MSLGAVEAADVVATSRLAYVEATAAFARKRGERGLTGGGYRTVLQNFEHDWESYFLVEVSDSLVKLAARLAEKHALRSYDAIHLASAVRIGRDGGLLVAFSCFDDRFSRCARREGLKVIG